MVEGAPVIRSILRDLRRYSKGRVVVAHSARFDAAFLGRSCVESAICTVLLARALVPEAPNHKNQTLRKYLQIDRIAREQVRAHRALADAIVTAHILIEWRRCFRKQYVGQSWTRFVRRNATVRSNTGRVA
jgi:DNA polymerase III epsilon subunit-like protein